MDRSRIALIVPAYNEAATIYQVVKSAGKYGQPFVVDDGSIDETAELAKQGGARVVSHAKNMGYDGALNSGFAEAYLSGYDIFITLDADGQHDPSLVLRFVQAMHQGADVVFGVRSERARLAELLFALYTKVKYGIDDPLCGMKAYSRSLYESLGHFDSYQSIGTELALYGVGSGLSFHQVHFVVKRRLDSPRFGTSLKANLKIMRALLCSILKT